MKGLYKVLCLIAALYALSPDSHVNCSYANYTKGEKRNHKYLPTSLEQLRAEGVQSIAEWKEKQWKDFMTKVKEEFNGFNKMMENEKKKWIDGKENEFKQWIKYIENKWEHSNEEMYNDILSTKAEESLTWGENEWSEWMNTTGKLLIKLDFNKWIESNEEFLKEGIRKDWEEWNKFKLREWTSVGWKNVEDKYWKYWHVNGKPEEPLYEIKMEKMDKWTERCKNEEIEWGKWIGSVEKVYINADWDKWVKWKNEKSTSFTNWIDSFATKWINNKQWKVWLEERNNAPSQ
ncbi:tryptophan-rich antigen [Plasmodium ovale curtisi]|uniref:Tryptophan-rich antigen n=1 Tax=Plasmodium ovale curtisi TaxID=864141 RepID=A0A1A8WMW2_PLAOA|nr:tryptophan-rich antigen [Plasmodium ovale curtisi]SBT01782.1 tryptophan-rich antigen [Plasmodium ovale curtisi]